MRAAGAVEEVGVEVDRRAVAAGADRDPPLHPVEVQRAAARRRPAARCTTRAGRRRHVDLRVDPGGGDLGRLLHLRRQRAVGDGEDVGVELRALVPGPDLGDHAGDRRPARRSGSSRCGHHDVVELQVGAGRDRRPELQRGRVGGAEHPADGLAGASTRCGLAVMGTMTLRRSRPTAPRRPHGVSTDTEAGLQVGSTHRLRAYRVESACPSAVQQVARPQSPRGVTAGTGRR